MQNVNAGEKICLECNREFTGIINICPHDASPLFARMQDPLIGTTLAGKYDIQEVIGHGGMGVVYKARHTLMDKVVAIKMLQAQLVSDSMSVKRFQQESKASSLINHPNVIAIHDFGISPTGQPYIVMDLLEGRSLADVIKTDGQVPVERALRILMQACDALNHAHKQGVIHRDLKPTNIVLCTFDDQPDFVKIVDFGVAKLMHANEAGQRLTQAGEVCGSPVYMSPEQCMGLDLDRRSDIYSMGVVIYETLSGKLPILGKTMVDTMSRHISEPPMRFTEARPDLYIPERVQSVIFKALAKDKTDRQQSMEQLRAELETAIPRPGRSEVLRTNVESYAAAPKSDSGKKQSLVPIAAAGVGLSAITALLLVMLSHKPPAAVTPTVAPATTQTTAPAGQTNLPSGVTPTKTPAKPVTPEEAAKPAASPQSSATESGTTASADNEETKHQHKPKKPGHSSVASAKRLTAANESRAAARAPAHSHADPFADLRTSHSWDH